MIIPQYSLRWLLGLTALCAGVSLVLSSANRGQEWAIGATAALASVVFLLVLYEGAFSVATLITQTGKALRPRVPVGDSPFAIKPPEESPFSADSPMTEGPSITG